MSEIKVGDRVWFRYAGHPYDGRTGRVNRDFRPGLDEFEIVIDGIWAILRSRPCFLEPVFPFEAGDRVRVNRTSQNQEYHGMEGRVISSVDEDRTKVLLDGLATEQTMWNEILEKIPPCSTVDSPDMVNSPPHYTGHPSGIECIAITEHMGFNLGNATKYIWRADLKANAIEDLKKAAWYLAREISKREKDSTK